MYRILYPEDRLVSDATIRAWFADAVANGEIIIEDAIELEDSLRYLMGRLEDAGLVTFATMELV